MRVVRTEGEDVLGGVPVGLGDRLVGRRGVLEVAVVVAPGEELAALVEVGPLLDARPDDALGLVELAALLGALGVAPRRPVVELVLVVLPEVAVDREGLFELAGLPEVRGLELTGLEVAHAVWGRSCR